MALSASTKARANKASCFSQLLVRHETNPCSAATLCVLLRAKRSRRTFIYLFEVEASGDTATDRALRHRAGIHVLQNDDFARYAIKMATAAARPKVMALTSRGSTSTRRRRSRRLRAFLPVVGAHVIVFERPALRLRWWRIFRTVR